MTDSKLQRLNMVESQVRTSDVTDRRIIKAMLEVPRERFVPDAYASMAYMDEPVPVGPANGANFRALLAPRAFAKLAQLAEVGPDMVVLIVGCATGYSAAVLARLAKRVVAVEVDPGLAATARRMLAELGAENATVVEGPLAAGAPGEAPFGVIFVDGAVQTIGPTLLEQLEDGGRLVAIMTGDGVSRAEVWRRTGKSIDRRPAFDAGTVLLPGFERPAGFVF